MARRSNRWVVVIGLIAFITVGAVFWQQHRDDERDERADRQYELDQCQRGNVTRKAIGDGFVDDSEALIAGLSSFGPPSERAQQFIDTYRAQVRENVKAFGPRDCVALLKQADK